MEEHCVVLLRGLRQLIITVWESRQLQHTLMFQQIINPSKEGDPSEQCAPLFLGNAATILR